MPLQFEIPNPLPATLEQQLMDALPNKMKSHRFRFFKRVLKDYRYTGKPAARLRRAKKTERKRPITRRWGGYWGEFFGGLDINSNIVLEMTLLAGHIQPAHARALCFVFGLLSEDEDVDIQILGRPGQVRGRTRYTSEPVDQLFTLLMRAVEGDEQIEILGV